MYELIIIGAGPGGISMGVEAHNFGVHPSKMLIFEKSDEHSFTIKKYYPDQKLVTSNYKGFTPVCTGVMCLTDSSKTETISYLDKAIEEHQLNVQYNESVYKIERQMMDLLLFIQIRMFIILELWLLQLEFLVNRTNQSIKFQEI